MVHKEKIILIGGGWHCLSCIDVIESENRFTISGIIDIPEKRGQKVLSYSFIGTDNEIGELIKEYSYFFITIGQIKSAQSRKERCV